MRISKTQLKQIIKEELAQALKEDGPSLARGQTEWSQATKDRAHANRVQQFQHDLDVEAGIIPADVAGGTQYVMNKSDAKATEGGADTGQSVASTEGKNCKMVCT